MGINSIVSSSVILESSNTNILDPMKTLDNVNTNESYAAEAIDFMRTMNEEYANQDKLLYLSMLEAGNTYAIHEGFSEFFSWMRKMIDKAIAFIKKMYDKFINFITKLFKADSYIKKNKDKITAFEGDFDIDGYKFTIDANIPALIEVEALEDIDGTKSAAEIKTAYDKNQDRLDDLLNSQRGKILGDNSTIDETDFNSECFKKFRDGEENKSVITIDKSMAQEAYNRFENYEKVVDSAKKECKRIISTYQDLGKLYDKMVKRTGADKAEVRVVNNNTKTAGDKAEVTGDDKIVELEKWAKLNVNYFQKLVQAHNLAFTAKLDALKAQFNQDKSICYQAINKAISTAKK